MIAAATALAAPQAAAEPAARWLIVVDDLHLDFRNTGRVRTLVTTIVAGLFRDGDEVAIYSTGPSAVSVAWTGDRSIVDNAVRNLAGNGLKLSDAFAMTQGLLLGDEVRYRATVALSRVNEIIAAIDPAFVRGIGIVYISNGYVDRVPSLTHVPGRARIPIFALDPRLLPGAIVDTAGVDAERWKVYWLATRNSLRALSEESGGFALAEGQDAEAALARFSERVRQ